MINYLEIGDQTILSTGDIEVVKTSATNKELVDAANKLESLNEDIKVKENDISGIENQELARSVISLLINGMFIMLMFLCDFTMAIEKIYPISPRVAAFHFIIMSIVGGGTSIRLNARIKHKKEIKNLQKEKSDLEEELKKVSEKVNELRKEKEVIACKELKVEVNNGIIPVQPTLIPVPERSNNKEKTLIR